MNNFPSRISLNGWLPSPRAMTTQSFPAKNNPFPGIRDMELGYYSYYLSTSFLPLSNCEDYGDFMVGEVPRNRIDEFASIMAHEIQGHGAFRNVSTAAALRVASAKAHEAIWTIMGGDEDGWQSLWRWNSTLRNIHSEFAPSNELFATLAGIRAIDEHPELHQPLPFVPYSSPKDVPGDTALGKSTTKINPQAIHSIMWGLKQRPVLDRMEKIERESVSRYNLLYHRKLKGFASFYWRLATLMQKCGGSTVYTLAVFIQEALRVEGVLEDVDPDTWNMLFLGHDIRSRLENALKAFEDAPYTETEFRSWKPDDFTEFCSQHIPGFLVWLEQLSYVSNVIRNQKTRQKQWWKDQGLISFNPVYGGELASFGMLSAKYFRPNLPFTYDTHSYEMDAIAHIGSVEQRELRYRIREKQITAQEQGRELVAIDVANGKHYGMCLIPIVSENSKSFTPFPYLSAPRLLPGDPGFEGAQTPSREHVPREEAKAILMELYGGYAALVFFEGLRLQVESGQGVHCPLRMMRHSQKTLPWLTEFSIPGAQSGDKGCCGLAAFVNRLWESGIRVGYSKKDWRRPTQCKG